MSAAYFYQTGVSGEQVVTTQPTELVAVAIANTNSGNFSVIITDGSGGETALELRGASVNSSYAFTPAVPILLPKGIAYTPNATTTRVCLYYT